MAQLKITCPSCKYTYEMTTKEKVNRSNPQNAYLWGVVYELISAYTGYTPSEVHEYCKLEFNSKTVHIGKDEVKIGLSTASLNTVEFSQYVERVRQFGAEQGIHIPDAI